MKLSEIAIGPAAHGTLAVLGWIAAVALGWGSLLARFLL
jgi:hypothetical protein